MGEGIQKNDISVLEEISKLDRIDTNKVNIIINENEFVIPYGIKYNMVVKQPDDALSKMYDEKNELIVNLRVPTNEYNDEDVQELIKWSKLSNFDEGYFRNLAVYMQMNERIERTVVFTHAHIRMNKKINTKADYVDIELIVNQRGDKFIGVGFGHSLEETLKKTKERSENPPKVNVIVPVVGNNTIEGVSILGNSFFKEERLEKLEEIKKKVVINSVRIVEDDIYGYYPNCYFEIKYEVLEKLDNELFTADEVAKIKIEKQNEDDKFILDIYEIEFPSEVGEYTANIRYYKTNPYLIIDEDYGKINISIYYEYISVNHTEFYKSLELIEVGRPTEFRVRYESLASYENYEMLNDLKSDNIVSGEQKIKISTDWVRGSQQLTIDDDWVKEQNINKFEKGLIFIGTTAIKVYLDAKTGGLSGKIFIGLGFLESIKSSNGTIENSIMQYEYSYYLIRKWIQFKDPVTGKFKNGYFADRIVTCEEFDPGVDLKDNGVRGNIQHYSYESETYSKIQEDNITEELKKLCYKQWRLLRVENILENNEPFPAGEFCRVEKYIGDGNDEAELGDLDRKVKVIDILFDNYGKTMLDADSAIYANNSPNIDLFYSRCTHDKEQY